MEVHKRKCLNGGEIEVKKQTKKAIDDGKSKSAAAAVEDDEVEEFYAIVRRIRVAMRFFEKGKAEGGGAGKKLTAAQQWNSGSRQEYFKGVVDGVKERDRAEENTGLDLNADPVTDPKSEAD